MQTVKYFDMGEAAIIIITETNRNKYLPTRHSCDEAAGEMHPEVHTVENLGMAESTEDDRSQIFVINNREP